MYINDPNYHRVQKECKKQKKAFEELMGGSHAMMGNTCDPWNQMGISWSIYNDFKNKGYSDDVISIIIKECNHFPALDKKKVEYYKNSGYSDDMIAIIIKECKPFPELNKIKNQVEDYKMRM